VNKDIILCPLFSVCCGCSIEKEIRNPPVWKELIAFLEGYLPSSSLCLVSKEITGWRSRAKLAVRGSKDSVKIGLFEENSHRIVDIETCPLHYPLMNSGLKEIREAISNFSIEPYEENTHQGRLRYLQMVINPKNSKMQLSFVLNGTFLKEEEKSFVKRLYNLGLFDSIWVNFLPERTNSIFGKDWTLAEGNEDFFQEVAGISFCVHPSCFFQAHLSVFEEMIFYIKSLLSKDKKIVELYAGVGCIGLHVAENASKVFFVESSFHAKESFEKTLKTLSKEIQDKCVFFSSSAEQAKNLLEEAEVVIVDPPRKGLSKECKALFFASLATELFYVSCGPSSFMRDCKEFIENGWTLENARGFLLFPGTNHVEIIAHFKRASS
jgi:23S rRNA (uracil-5-)-methyltransferase RumA